MDGLVRMGVTWFPGVMDELDNNLVEAWGEVWGRCVRDRAEARKRWGRTRGVGMSKPVRAWCLTLRASDTRIGELGGWIDDPRVFAERRGHGVVIGGAGLRRLCAPVRIDWPGVKLCDAAGVLGRSVDAVRHWMPVRPGRERGVGSACPAVWEELSEAGKPLCVRYEPARVHGHGGGDVAVVWTKGELNPGERWGRGPGAVWGSLWRGLSEKLPEGYELAVRREPRFKRYGEGERFRGWDWVCPGRMVDGVWRVCGRRSRLLFGPLPVWTLGKGLGVREGLDVGGGAGAAGVRGLRLGGGWYVGEEDAMCGVRSFACRKCWGVAEPDLRTREGWNDFVMTVSGGLLYGREVRRPSWLGEVVRKGEIRGRKKRERGVVCDVRRGVG